MNSINFYFFYLINGMAGHCQILDSAMVFLTNVLAYSIGALALVYICIIVPLQQVHPLDRLRSLAQGGELLVSLIISGCITFVLKMVVAVPRPFTILNNVRALTPYESGYSFPSAHATIMVTIAAATYFYHRRLGITLYVFGVLVAISRVYVGVHYPVDIIAGAGIGFGSAYLIHAIFKKIKHNFIKNISIDD